MTIEFAYRACHMHIMHSHEGEKFKKGIVTDTCVMATVIHGTYGLLRSRLYVSHILVKN